MTCPGLGSAHKGRARSARTRTHRRRSVRRRESTPSRIGRASPRPAARTSVRILSRAAQAAWRIFLPGLKPEKNAAGGPEKLQAAGKDQKKDEQADEAFEEGEAPAVGSIRFLHRPASSRVINRTASSGRSAPAFPGQGEVHLFQVFGDFGDRPGDRIPGAASGSARRVISPDPAASSGASNGLDLKSSSSRGEEPGEADRPVGFPVDFDRRQEQFGRSGQEEGNQAGREQDFDQAESFFRRPVKRRVSRHRIPSASARRMGLFMTPEGNAIAVPTGAGGVSGGEPAGSGRRQPRFPFSGTSPAGPSTGFTPDPVAGRVMSENREGPERGIQAENYPYARTVQKCFPE